MSTGLAVSSAPAPAADEDMGAANMSRPACNECQRRKQKCNREWPCQHCLKRKVADRCRYNHDATSTTTSTGTAAEKQPGRLDTKRKRQLADSSAAGSAGDEASASDEHLLTRDEAVAFKELGYMPSHHLYRLAIDDGPSTTKSAGPTPPSVLPQLDRALHCLPPRPYTDMLVETFKDNVNFHYYIIYPPSFLDEYRAWWTDRAKKKPLDLSWTCLLIVVCASAAQYLDPENQQQIELDLGESAQTLTQRYHAAAQELANVVPASERSFAYVQYLLHSCYWYKSEARFVECWHTLNSAICEAQELGIHTESQSSSLSEFDREMRRRLWCIMDVWDWQISGLLSRSLIIDRDDCNVELPSLALEKDQPSPILHMKLQSQLIGQLSRKYGKAMNLMVATPAGVHEYRRHVEAWRSTFPPRYNGDDPDTSLDEQNPWLVLHRHYLQTISLLMLLEPFKSYLTRTPAPGASESWLEIRRLGIDYCLKLMSALYGFFNHTYPRDAKFHFVLFCIFDISTVLCSAILHDERRDLPRRDEVYDAVASAADMLRKLASVTTSAATSNAVLQKLKLRLPPRDAPPAADPRRPPPPSDTSSATSPNCPTAYPKKKARTAATTATSESLSTPPAPHSDSMHAHGAGPSDSGSGLSSGVGASVYAPSSGSDTLAPSAGDTAGDNDDADNQPRPLYQSNSSNASASLPAAPTAHYVSVPPAPGAPPNSVTPAQSQQPYVHLHHHQHHHHHHAAGGINSVDPNSHGHENGGNAGWNGYSNGYNNDLYVPIDGPHSATTSATAFMDPALPPIATAPQHTPVPFPMPIPMPDPGSVAAPAPASDTTATFQDLGLGDITQEDMGDFGIMWNWDQLDLGYQPQPQGG